MRVLLISINAKYIHTNNAVRLLKVNSSFQPTIFEYTIKDDIDTIIKDIESFQPDVVGFSTYIWNVSIIKNILNELKLEGKIVLGGPEVSYDSLYFLDNTNADIIVKGEGEQVFESLLHAIHNKTSLVDIPSITTYENGKLINNPIQEIKHLEELHMPYYLEEDITQIPNKIAYIESSRGCPYKCSYCLSSLEKTVRFFPLQTVQNAIEYLLNNGAKTIKFLDRTFNANKHTFDLLDFIIKQHNHTTVFQFEITGDILDPNIITYLNQNAPKGLFRFEIGIQSTNPMTNKLVDRFQNTERLFHNIQLIQSANIIDLHLDLIAGLPLEDLSSFQKTFDSVFRLKSKELQLGFLKMLRGTKIRNQSDLYDYVYDQNAPYEIIENNVLSKQDIKEIHLVEHMLELYHNKGYFKEEMLQLILSKESPYAFFKEIGEHYLKHKYPMRQYQLEDIYNHIFELLSNKEIFALKKDYLNRSKIKPKIFFNNDISKEEKKLVFTILSNKTNYPINLFYKHGVLIKYELEYYTVLYQNNESQNFTIHLKKTP